MPDLRQQPWADDPKSTTIYDEAGRPRVLDVYVPHHRPSLVNEFSKTGLMLGMGGILTSGIRLLAVPMAQTVPPLALMLGGAATLTPLVMFGLRIKDRIRNPRILLALFILGTGVPFLLPASRFIDTVITSSQPVISEQQPVVSEQQPVQVNLGRVTPQNYSQQTQGVPVIYRCNGTEADANLRDAPGGRIIGIVPFGSAFRPISHQDRWVEVETASSHGFISACFIEGAQYARH